jgi:tight adherence protein C
MAAVILPLTLGVAAFLLIHGLLAPTKVSRRAQWRDEVLGKRAAEPIARRRRGENLRTKSFFERMIQAPPSLVEPANRMIGAAGMSARMTGASFAGFALSVGGLVTVLALLVTVPGGLTSIELAIAGGASAFGFIGPWIVLSGRASRRRNMIDLALPDMLDLLTVSVEAGLAVEAALARVSERGESPLHIEVRRTMSEIALGRRRRDALQALSRRVDVPPVNSLVNAMNQADRSGMQLGPVLRSQAEQIRQRRRQRAEEAAMKAPIKMLFPLVFFIFPAMFIVILGPAALNLMEVFG